MHTNGWTLGFGEPLGQADFFPNYGRSQPGCGVDLTGSCAHGRAPTFFAESLNNNQFIAQRCASFDEVNNGRCTVQSSGHRMGGEPANSGLQGFFYLTTNSNSPFGRG
jgi:pancreatic triacylglycerol lipase